MRNYTHLFFLVILLFVRGISSKSEDVVTVVVVSDRVEGVITALGSIVKNTVSHLEIILIGEEETNAMVKRHFKDRVTKFVTATKQEIDEDLTNNGLKPIWLWNDWHSSFRQDWKNVNTLRLEEWDGLDTHSNYFNHVRFYLPHLSILSRRDHFIFLDDDVLVQKDVVEVLDQATNLSDSTVLTCPCNSWKWNDDCHHFDFHSKDVNIIETAALYSGVQPCAKGADVGCVPSNWGDFLNEVRPFKNHQSVAPQPAWNFGFCLVHGNNWREEKATEKYEFAMAKNYDHHKVPENSLAFGLGLPFIALDGHVACFDDSEVKIRDGFGFIEWSRFQSAFGKDFYSHTDVLHFTGPEKPWKKLSTIDTKSLSPWLEMMAHENLTLPQQLPLNQTTPMFQLLTSWRSGSEWVMNMLDRHPHVCASGESHRPEIGFPTEAMTPHIMYLPECSVKVGCTYSFVQAGIKAMLQHGSYNSGEVRVPLQCLPSYQRHDSDTLPADHRLRLCNFIEQLDGNYTNEAVFNLWVEAFRTEDKDLLGCSCQRGTKIKGLKVMTDWVLRDKAPLPSLEKTAFAGSKIIRLKRENLWSRWYSLFKAQHTGLWHVRDDTNRNETNYAKWTVDVPAMVKTLQVMKSMDEAGDKWAEKYGSEVLWIDYDDCKDDQDSCRREMLDFLGIESDLSEVSDNGVVKKASTSQDHLKLTLIENRDEVREALHSNNFGHHLLENDYVPIQILIYETDLRSSSHASKYVKQLRDAVGLNITVFGKERERKGFGSKYAAALPILKRLPKNALIVLSDSRDVVFNIPRNQKDLYKALVKFRADAANMLEEAPGGVILSAESQCCVSAMSHVGPGELFASDGSRNGFACSSGKPGCMWRGQDGKVREWHHFMKNAAKRRSFAQSEDVYLNAGLIAGKAGDLERHIMSLQMQETEDDQAVWTDYMYRKPEYILLDYSQLLFGTNIWGKEREGCVFAPSQEDERNISSRRLHHRKTNAVPLFIHSPGGNEACHSHLLQLLDRDLDVADKSNLSLEDWDNSGAGTSRRLQENYGSNVEFVVLFSICSGCENTDAQLDQSFQVKQAFTNSVFDGGDVSITFSIEYLTCDTPCISLSTPGGSRFLQEGEFFVRNVTSVIQGPVENLREGNLIENIQKNQVLIGQALNASGIVASIDFDKIEDITSTSTKFPSAFPSPAPSAVPSSMIVTSSGSKSSKSASSGGSKTAKSVKSGGSRSFKSSGGSKTARSGGVFV